MQTPRVIRCLLLSAALAGCGTPVEPEDLVGDYPLTHVRGDVLPQLVSATSTCDVTLISGELDLRQIDWSVLDLVQQIDCSAGGSSDETGVRYVGWFKLVGEALTFYTTRSETDTLRFAGEVHGSVVELTLDDPERGLPGPLRLRFGPVEPLEPGTLTRLRGLTR